MMNEKSIKWIKDVAFTTFLAFFLIGFLVLGLYAVVGKDAQTISLLDSSRFFLGKMYMCVFAFSLCLGFLNRMIEKEGNHAVKRVIHFLLGFAAYFIFMDLLFNYLFLGAGETVEFRQILTMTLPYFIFYPITLWITRLGRAIFLPKEKKEFKSILD